MFAFRLGKFPSPSNLPVCRRLCFLRKYLVVKVLRQMSHCHCFCDDALNGAVAATGDAGAAAEGGDDGTAAVAANAAST